MSSIRTLLTELLTAVGILDCPLESSPPSVFRNVHSDVWREVLLASSDPQLEKLSEMARSNGRGFFESRQGLRGRYPLVVEWKGKQKPPGYEFIPADIRVDHVYLISCKYNSQIQINTSPARLFDRTLQSRYSQRKTDWYNEVAPEAYLDLYHTVTKTLGIEGLPNHPHKLNKEQKAILRRELRGLKKCPLLDQFREFSHVISLASEKRWKAHLGSKLEQEEMTWRLLRLADAPYFLLGSDRNNHPIQVRIGTPWDWRAHYSFRGLEIQAQLAGQPVVTWSAHATARASGLDVSANGHIEIRWSHGKFNGAPEAKVYLDTPHCQVPGYFALS